MARFFHSDVARWEGEGGAPASVSYSRALRGVRNKHRISWTRITQIVSGALLVGLLVYARRKVSTRTPQNEWVR